MFTHRYLWSLRPWLRPVNMPVHEALRALTSLDLKDMQGFRVYRVRQPEETLICGSNAGVVDLIFELQ